MVFSAPSFLFLFLPILLVLYRLAPIGVKNQVLLVASLLFYAWGERVWVLLMLASILFNYGLGLLLAGSKRGRRTRPILVLALVGNLGALIAFKYANFLLDNLSLLTESLLGLDVRIEPVHLPIGISFFTFQALSYVIDLHRREVSVQRNPLDLALYISLFPQLIAGPIVRYGTIADQLSKRVSNLPLFACGIRRFTIGLAKKVLIADPCGIRADLIFGLPGEELSTSVAWFGLICYSVQIYFDFSGYSDMAIGLGRMFGFRFPENFDYPYISKSITEFWRRWHISLSTWFRDYLYIPLGGNRVSRSRTLANLITVFVLCGLWHGASWNFLIWGLLHGSLLVCERLPFGRVLRSCPPVLRHGYVLLAAMLAWVPFRAETLQDTQVFLSALFSFSGGELAGRGLGFFLNVEIAVVLLCAAIGATPILPWLRERLDVRIGAQRRAWLASAAIAVLLLASAVLVAASSYSPFIYFRF